MSYKPLTIAAARQMAHEELVKWGLSDWSVRINPRLRRSLGRCLRKQKVIELSLRHVQHDPPDEVLNTIRHEIAHALTRGGHNRAFYAMCKTVGARPQRLTQIDRPFCYPDERPKYACGCHCKTVLYKRRPSTLRTDEKGRVFSYGLSEGEPIRKYRICPKCLEHVVFRTVTHLPVMNYKVNCLPTA